MGARPLIIGHRGASALAPENTLAAFARALHDGADGIEFDVRLSKDNVPVVIHDATLSRTARTARSVADLSSRELKGIGVGSWFNSKFPHLARPEYAEEKLPTLKRAFDLLSRSKGLLYLEMKCDGSACESLAYESIELIQNYSFAERAIVECFHLPAITQVKKLDSRIRTAALFEPRLKQPTSLLKRMAMVEKARDCGADEIALHHTLITERVVDRARLLDIPCVVWTVDHPRWVRRAASLGLKALITNNPARMIQAGNVSG
jgi:glycerophosphoryl diester phosphodiesterase